MLTFCTPPSQTPLNGCEKKLIPGGIRGVDVIPAETVRSENVWNTLVRLNHQNVLEFSSNKDIGENVRQKPEKSNSERMEVTALETELMVTVKEVIDGFDLVPNGNEYSCEKDSLWDLMESDLNLEQQIVQFIHENPGRSCNAIFKCFREKGFTYTDVLETYNILVYDKKMLLRINVGTATSPRYAHFVTGHVHKPGKDVLYDILGPI